MVISRLVWKSDTTGKELLMRQANDIAVLSGYLTPQELCELVVAAQDLLERIDYEPPKQKNPQD
jgi:hypothetical protein